MDGKRVVLRDVVSFEWTPIIFNLQRQARDKRNEDSQT
jgi:hypothetical protein